MGNTTIWSWPFDADKHRQFWSDVASAYKSIPSWLQNSSKAFTYVASGAARSDRLNAKAAQARADAQARYNRYGTAADGSLDFNVSSDLGSELDPAGEMATTVLSSAPMINYPDSPLASEYRMDRATAYQEALANSAYQRMVVDMRKAGLNPVLGIDGSGAAVFSGTAAGSGSGAGSTLTSAEDKSSLRDRIGKAISASAYPLGSLISRASKSKIKGDIATASARLIGNLIRD